MRTRNLDWTEIDDRNISLSRGIALDALSRAGSGHPGATLSLTPLLYLLMQKIMVHDSSDPEWILRDKLILSCGHASLALYIQLHLAGYEVSDRDLREFRRLGSNTPGHPERGKTPGVETTTGPLGQGFANAVGIALSARIHQQGADADKSTPRIYCVVSDGDLQEGISFEAASLAAHYKLSNLTLIFDSNQISIDGATSLSTSVKMVDYFISLGWEVSRITKKANGDINPEIIGQQILDGEYKSKPHIIVMESEIGWPSPSFKSTAFIHGNILPPDEAKAIKSLLDLDPENETVFPTTLVTDIRESNRKRLISRFGTEPTHYLKQEMEISKIIEAIQQIRFPDSISTRKANGIIINEIKKLHPWTLGGSADLTESNGLTLNNLFDPQTKSTEVANNLVFGVREHSMSAITNGLSLDSRNITYCATYLGFSDYQKPAIRLSALMNLPVTYIWTHDSIALGADGPTHQPIEHLAALRAIPNFAVIRPGSASELQEVWIKVLKERKPVGLVLSRQDLENNKSLLGHSNKSQKGGYIYVQNFVGESPKVILIATGSELELAKKVAFDLRLANQTTRVVSMPCWEWFEEEIGEYREAVIPSTAELIVSIEAASTFGWEKFTGTNGLNIGIDTFGESGRSEELMEKFGFTSGQVVSKILERLSMIGVENK